MTKDHDRDGDGRDQGGGAEPRDGSSDRERLHVQTREANERLVIASLRADELAEQAVTTSAELRARHDALRASESEAQASNRAKDDFLAMLGHELRNPLAPILIALDLIAMDTADPHQREHSIIAHQVKQLSQLVEDLLDVARIRSGKVELHREPIELAVVVARAVETASPLIESKRHRLLVDVPAHGLVVDGDLLRLIQAVGNLLTNAAKYTPAGGSITVTAERRGTIATVRVRDSGVGITADMLPRIFDLFAQEHQPKERAAGGLGLGLAIVRSLVVLHGGTVTAHSDGLGRGTELVIELPVLAGASDSAGPAPQSSPMIAPRAAHKVLVVDDNPDVAELTGIALARLGHDVRVAFDGGSALAIVDGFVPDIVLLDIGLPEMDGYELAKLLRAKLPGRELHFIAVSGYGQPLDRRRSKDAGFDEHLVKPVDLAALQHCIEATSPASRW